MPFHLLKNLIPIELKRRIKNLAGTTEAGRNLTVLENDCFIVSYPKSGNTWLRFLVANLITKNETIDFDNIQSIIPDIYITSNQKLLSYSQPRYLKSHEYFDPRYQKIIYLIRDVRSVIVSYYHYKIRKNEIDQDLKIYHFTKIFLDGMLDDYGTWSDNILSWVRMRGNCENAFFLVKYEDLKEKGLFTLMKIANFLNLSFDIEELKEIYDACDFRKMKSLEKQSTVKWNEKFRRANKNIDFIRVGIVDEWKQVLDEKSLNLVKNSCGDLLKELGYKD